MKDTLTNAEYRILSRALAVGIVASESAARKCLEKGLPASAEYHQNGVAKIEEAYAVLLNLRTQD